VLREWPRVVQRWGLQSVVLLLKSRGRRKLAKQTACLAIVGVFLACNFPKAQDPDDVAAEEAASEPSTSQSQPQSTPLPPECKTTGADVVALALEGASQGFHGDTGPGQVERGIDERCHRALEAKRLELIAHGQALEARRLQLEEERERDAQDKELLDQLKALCADGKQPACAAYAFANAKRGCCAWHHGARMCSAGKVVCFDGAESPTCTC
jgi:hypothetical protein